MNQEFKTDIPNYEETSIFKRLTRYSIKPPGIILDRHATVTGEPVLDPKGEWMKVQQLASIIHQGGLMIVDDRLVNHLKDGDAHQQLMTTLDRLGYDSFEQVIQVLTEQRGTVLQLREFEVWSAGYKEMGEIDEKARLLGKGLGRSFNEACINLKEQLGEHKTKDWYFDKNGDWFNYAGRMYPTEAEARKVNG